MPRPNRRAPITLTSREAKRTDPRSPFMASHSLRQPESFACAGCATRTADPGLFCEACRMHVALRP